MKFEATSFKFHGVLSNLFEKYAFLYHLISRGKFKRNWERPLIMQNHAATVQMIKKKSKNTKQDYNNPV